MNEFFKRSLSGAVFLVVMLGSILWNQLSLLVLLLFISGVALFEFYRIFQKREIQPLFSGGIASAFFILILVSAERMSLVPDNYLFLIILPVVMLWFSFIFIKRKQAIYSMLITVSGLIYILLPLSLIPFLTQNSLTDHKYNPEILIGILLVIWTYDSFAYITGISFGKHKMVPEISPKKSWEGFFGGLVFAIITGLLYARFTSLLSYKDWLFLSFIVVLAGTAGDLFESLLKREAGVKDSGNIMPGHGGILDRFDSILFIIPFVFIYLYFIKI